MKRKSAYVTTYAWKQPRVRACSSGVRTYATYANCRILHKKRSIKLPKYQPFSNLKTNRNLYYIKLNYTLEISDSNMIITVFATYCKQWLKFSMESIFPSGVESHDQRKF